MTLPTILLTLAILTLAAVPATLAIRAWHRGRRADAVLRGLREQWRKGGWPR